MGTVRLVIQVEMADVLLFCAARCILPAQSVVLGWQGLFGLSPNIEPDSLPGSMESNPSRDTDRPFICRGTERKDLEKGFLDEDEEPMLPGTAST